MKEKILNLIFCALVTCMPAIAQTRSISARVISVSDSIPVEFATVKLLRPDSVIIATILTDANGSFGFDTTTEKRMYLTINYMTKI